MSTLQQEAKPELIAMLEDRPITLLDAAQRVVAAWVAMAVMVGEHFFEGAVAIPAVDRLSMKHTSCVPQNWKIWVGSFERNHWPAYFALGTRALPAYNGAPSPSGVCNAQTSTFAVGSVLFHAFSCQSSQIAGALELACDDRLPQIWPPLAPVAWPPRRLDETQADRISSFILDAYSGDGFRGLPFDW